MLFGLKHHFTSKFGFSRQSVYLVATSSVVTETAYDYALSHLGVVVWGGYVVGQVFPIIKYHRYLKHAIDMP